MRICQNLNALHTCVLMGRSGWEGREPLPNQWEDDDFGEVREEGIWWTRRDSARCSGFLQPVAAWGLSYSLLCTRVHMESVWTFLSSFLCSLWKRRERGKLSRVGLGKEWWGLEEISHPMEVGSNRATSSLLHTMDYQSSKNFTPCPSISSVWGRPVTSYLLQTSDKVAERPCAHGGTWRLGMPSEIGSGIMWTMNNSPCATSPLLLHLPAELFWSVLSSPRVNGPLLSQAPFPFLLSIVSSTSLSPCFSDLFHCLFLS